MEFVFVKIHMWRSSKNSRVTVLFVCGILMDLNFACTVELGKIVSTGVSPGQ
jgi:hypothetical protein